MREVTREMIKLYNIKKLGYDFMGYTFNRPEELSFHHLIIPHRDCKREGLGEGYLMWNGAILKQETSHEYLHTIELYEACPSKQKSLTVCEGNHNTLRQLSVNEKICHFFEAFLIGEKEIKKENN